MPADIVFITDMLSLSDLPRDKSFPTDAVQCDSCGGHGCKLCRNRGWVPADHPAGRRCHRDDCGNPIPPAQVAVYCSDECAFADASPDPKRETLFSRDFSDGRKRSFEIVEHTGALMVLREDGTDKLYDLFVSLAMHTVVDQMKKHRRVESSVGFKLTGHSPGGFVKMHWEVS